MGSAVALARLESRNGAEWEGEKRNPSNSVTSSWLSSLQKNMAISFFLGIFTFVMLDPQPAIHRSTLGERRQKALDQLHEALQEVLKFLGGEVLVGYSNYLTRWGPILG